MLKKYILTLFIFLFMSGCVSPPAPENNQNEVNPPGWVLAKPQDDNSFMYFTGTGTSDSGDHADAKNFATSGLLAEIMQYIGVTITTETEATAKATLDQFQANITQTVTQESTATLAGFEVVEIWIDERRSPAITIYILARYSKIELDKEKARLEALIIEQDEAISIPEAEGLNLFSEGRYYAAAIKFITAAGAASKSTIPNADIKFKRNIDYAMSSIEQINLIKINDNISGLAGQELDPFQAKVVTGGSLDDPGVPDVAILINYRELYAPTGRLVFRNQTIKTDNSGIAAFNHPIPDFVGSSEVSFSLDLSAYLDDLQDVPDEHDALVHSLEELIVKKNIIFSFEVTSNAKNIKTGIFIINYDENNNITGTLDTASGMQSVLSDYNLVSLSMSASELRRMNRDEIIASLKAKYAGQIERLLFGTVKIENYSQNSGRTFAEATATIQVWELSTDILIYTTNKDKNGMGDTNSEAAFNANQDIGVMLGNDVRNNLR